MSKELEALERVGNNLEHHYPENIKDFNILKQALQRLETIDNSNPSKALKNLEKIKTKFRNTCLGIYLEDTKEFDTIKQTLLKAQEQDKVLEITKEHLTFKDSGIEEYTDILTNKKVKKHCIKIESKDTGATIHIHLDTQEEFDLLKRWVENV